MGRELHALLIILIMGLVTLATRILPVLVFGRGQKVPGFILYLGKTVPYTAMGLLIVYCLKDVSIAENPHGIPEFAALLAVGISYLWKKNTILSVLAGTLLYIFLIQKVF